MSTEGKGLACLPQPQSLYKRARLPLPPLNLHDLDDLNDLDILNPPPTKRRRLQSQHADLPVFRATSAPPWPTRAPRSQHCRPHSPQPTTLASSIESWISIVLSSGPGRVILPPDRPSTCPASVDVSREKRAPLSLATIKQMSNQLSPYGEIIGSDSGSGSGASLTARPWYRGTLYGNYITLDSSGRQIPDELRTFVSTQILKRRASPQLGDDAVSRVMETAEDLADCTEGPITKLLRTDMFPFERAGIAEGGASPWSTIASPNNPESQYDVAAPKPDAHFGYPTNQRSGWSHAQDNVITHPMARNYAQPARGNIFPFLMVEMKSEAAGGTIYVAENQAAGSGSHSVNALRWLLREAGTLTRSSLTDTIAFTIAMSHRQAVFYLHWYSEAERRFFMSYLMSCSSMEPGGIRACNNIVKNVIDHGLGARRTAIGTALEALFPFPQQWKQARSTSTTRSTTVLTSAEEMRSSKGKSGKGNKR